MRKFTGLAILTAVCLAFSGCGPGAVEYDETTDSFVGKLVQNGQAVALPEGAELKVVHNDTGDNFGIPLKPDGSFEIGWMPTGAYSARLIWTKAAKKGKPGGGSSQTYVVPEGFSIAEGKAEYEIELGKDFKP